MKKICISLAMVAMSISANAENDVVEIFKSSFENVLSEKYEWLETNEWYEDRKAHVFLYETGIKAELRTCVNSENKILLSGTTTGGYRVNADIGKLKVLEKHMKSFYKSLAPSLIADPQKDGCETTVS